MKVTYLPEASTPDPLGMLYLAYKGTVTRQSLQQFAVDVAANPLAREGIVEFVQQQAMLGHTSPWHMVFAAFAIEGISRACSAQLERHHVGVSFEERSLRAVDGAQLAVVVPPSIEHWPDPDNVDIGDLPEQRFLGAAGYAQETYHDLTRAAPPIPCEDARYALPLGTETQLLMTASLSALLHMADERLCTAAQWEIRRLFIALRHAYVQAHPALGRLLAPKCAPHRLGYCNEPLNRYERCPLAAARPHKRAVLAWAETKGWRRLNDADVEELTEVPS